jgi:hypothetical protein
MPDHQAIEHLLEQIYPRRGRLIHERIAAVMDAFRSPQRRHNAFFSQEDVVLAAAISLSAHQTLWLEQTAATAATPC